MTALDRFPTGLILALGAAFALGVALISQFGFGYAPCELCIWQRWPYVAVIGLGLGAAATRGRPTLSRALAALAVLALAVDAGIAGFHVGVEQGWWQGLASCGGVSEAGSIDDLKAQIMDAPLVRCTDIALSVLGLSMAAWNGLFATALALFGLRGILKSQTQPREGA